MVVSDQPVADFSHLTAPEQLAAISRIENVALVIVPESLAAAYAAIPCSQTAATIYVPDGANVRIHTGALIVGGDGIGATDDVLIITGVLIITSAVTGPVPHRIHVVGSVLAPRGSEAALGPALAGGTGGVSYYTLADGQDIRVLSGQVRLSGAMLANPAGQAGDVLMAAGQVVITGEITTVGYRQVIIAGQLAAPAASRDVIEPRAQVQGARHQGLKFPGRYQSQGNRDRGRVRAGTEGCGSGSCGRSLLILDNCEHLLKVAAGFAEKLLADCAELTIVATSRERLAISGERTVPFRRCPSSPQMRMARPNQRPRCCSSTGPSPATPSSPPPRRW